MHTMILLLATHMFLYSYVASVTPLERMKRDVFESPSTHSVNNSIKSYVGLGFDTIEGNPFDSFNDLNTFGFRSSVIKQPLIKVDRFNNVTVEGSKHMWIRHIVNCYQEYEPRLIETGNDLVQELVNDFSMDNPFSEEMWKRNENALDWSKLVNDDSSLKVVKCYCSLYETGLVTPQADDLSEGFVKAVENLPDKPDRVADCPFDVFITEPENDACKNIRSWITFFKTYGTHITTYALIGGKFINAETFVNLHINDRQNNSGVNNNTQTMEIFKRNIKGTKLKKHLWIIGGSFVKGLDEINPRTFSRWVKTIEDRPMPIKAKFSMLSIFFPEKHEAYLGALDYYSKLNGI